MTETHRHDWTTTDDLAVFACSGCAEQTRACMECAQAVGSSLLICENCLTKWRHVITDTYEALQWVAAMPEAGPRPVRAVRYDRTIVSGTGTGESKAIAPADIPHIHATWANIWHHHVKDAEPVNPSIYLADHLIWAAHNTELSTWDIVKKDLKDCRTVARQAAALLPERMHSPCVNCGGTAIRDRATKRWEHRPDGLSEQVRCVDCKTTWQSVEQFEFVARTHIRAIPEAWPELTVTLEEATKSIWRNVPAPTIYTAVKRDRERHEAYLRAMDQHVTEWNKWVDWCNANPDAEWPDPPQEPKLVERQIPERGYDTDGTPVYLVADLTAIVDKRMDPNRRGPKARELVKG